MAALRVGKTLLVVGAWWLYESRVEKRLDGSTDDEESDGERTGEAGPDEATRARAGPDEAARTRASQDGNGPQCPVASTADAFEAASGAIKGVAGMSKTEQLSLYGLYKQVPGSREQHPAPHLV